MQASREAAVNMLYVDADPAFLELMSSVFPKYGGFTVLTAQSTTTALDIIEAEQLDCVVFDYQLLDASKLEYLKTITEQISVSPSQTNRDVVNPPTTITSTTQTDENFRQENGGTENFPEVVQQIEILTGKRCVGLQLQPRSQPFPIPSTSIGQSSGQSQLHVDGYPDRIKYQKPLKALHKATSELMEAQTKDAILDIAVETADEILQLPAVGIYLWDEQSGILRPHTVTPETESLFGELPTFSGPNSLAWDTFLDGEFRIYEDLSHCESRYNPETPIEAELFAPLGDHGLLISGSTETDIFDTPRIKATQTLVANTVTALDLENQRRELQQKQQQLHHQNEQLTTLKRVNSIIRNIGQATVTSSTRPEIEQTICENLTAIEPYCFAWMGERDHDETLSPRQWNGTNSNFLDQLCENTGGSNEQTPPAEIALHTGERQVIHNIFDDESFAPWQKSALDRDFQSVISLPLSNRETTYGVLEVYASEPSAFAAEEQEALSELSEMIVNAFTALERKQTLVADAQTELELQMRDEDDIFSRAARQANARLKLDTLVSRDDGTWLVYMSATKGTASAILSTISGFTAVESAQQIRANDDTKFFGVVLTEFELAELLTTHGAKLKSISAGSDGTTLTLSVSDDANVRSLISMFRTTYSSIDLVRRNSSVDDESTAMPFQSLDQLTDRQHEVLEVAVNRGFFDWPREHTGEEIADHLGISAPTFHRHIRRALQELLGTAFKA